MMILEVTGKGAHLKFVHEPGGHRWQRIPPTEKRGRRHTSTVTVAVLPVHNPVTQQIQERDIEWKAVIGSGSGGQAKQKTSNAVQMKHIPTGIQVRVETSRSQHENRQSALRLLSARILEHDCEKLAEDERNTRRFQTGSGMRGDKIRTIRLQDDTVTNHLNGKTMSAKKYLRGEMASLL